MSLLAALEVAGKGAAEPQWHLVVKYGEAQVTSTYPTYMTKI